MKLKPTGRNSLTTVEILDNVVCDYECTCSTVAAILIVDYVLKNVLNCSFENIWDNYCNPNCDFTQYSFYNYVNRHYALDKC